MKKRMMSILLVSVMVLAILPINCLNVFSADASHYVDAATAASRTNTLIDRLAGKYFTTTQSSCGNSICDACKNSNVIGTSWLKNTMGLVPDSASLLPEHYRNTSGGVITSTAWSCAGFANYCLWYIYAQNSSDNVRRVNIYSGYFTKSDMDSSGIRTGDVIRINDQHSVVYISHDSSGVTVLDSNWDSSYHNLVKKHTISWNWKAGTMMAVTRGKNWTTGTHSHSYSSTYYESAHPHKVYKKCSCGDYYYTGDTQVVSSCSQCSFTQDSKYNTVKGFKAYPCVSSNFEVKTSDLSTRGGEIYTTDLCTINELYTNGWCKVTFPMDSGGTRTAYTPISNFIKNTSASLTKYTASEYINLYSTSSLSTKIYRIYPGDVCYTVGTSGSATQIFMPMGSEGYYVLGWANLPTSTPTVNTYNVPFKCRTISTDKVVCYNDIDFTSSPGKIYPDDDCVITAVYSNGKVQVSCPWSDGTTKTVYVNKSVFINSNTTPVNKTAVKYAKTYLRTDMSKNIGWIDAGNAIQIVATSGDKTQIIYPADVGLRCAWVYTSDLVQTYTVSYNANGGTGAPSSQTKTSDVDLTLSTVKPQRTGHTFVGWSTSSTATTAQYSAGSVYSNNSSVTLYAVWRKQSYTITYNANGGSNAPAVQTQTFGDAITVTSSTPKKYYTVTFDPNGGVVNTSSYSLECPFASWNTSSSGTGSTVKPGSSYTPNANVTLYAIYSNPRLSSYPIPDMGGYTFNGWYTSPNGGTKVDVTTTVTGNVTYYAHWDVESYSVIYYDDGSVNIPAEQSKIYGQNLTLSSVVPVKSGYIFKGWTTKEGSTVVEYLPGSVYTENTWLILYAVWEKEPVVLTDMKINALPVKTVYEIGEELDTTGLVLALIYSDGNSETVSTGFTVSGFDSKTSGTKTVTIGFDDLTTTFEIIVNEPAKNPGIFTVESKTVNEGDIFTVNVDIKDNPGIVSLKLAIEYDTDKLQLLSANQSDFNGVSFGQVGSPFFVNWVDTINPDNTNNGTLATLAFMVINGAICGDTEISLSYDSEDVYDYDMNNVYFETQKGIVTIVEDTFEPEPEPEPEPEEPVDPNAPAVVSVNNYTISLDKITNIKEIRFAIGHYTKGADIKAAEKNVTLDASTVKKYTTDGIMTYDLPWMGEYTFWVRYNDGSQYFVYTNVDDITPYVESYGVKLTVKDYAENYKDMWLAEGTFNTYNEIKASTAFKYQASQNKLDLYAKTTHDFSYTMTNPGAYTVLIRYNDGTVDVIHTELTVDVPEFSVNGLQVTVDNIPDIKIIRTAYGHYTSVGDIKKAAGVRNFSNKNDIKNAEKYMIQYREAGEVTMIVEYNNGYKHFCYVNIEPKTATMIQSKNTVMFDDLDGFVMIRYAKGVYTTSSQIKVAAGSKVVKPADLISGYAIISNLEKGTYTFCVQFDDESYNYYVITVE